MHECYDYEETTMPFYILQQGIEGGSWLLKNGLYAIDELLPRQNKGLSSPNYCPQLPYAFIPLPTTSPHPLLFRSNDLLVVPFSFHCTFSTSSPNLFVLARNAAPVSAQTKYSCTFNPVFPPLPPLLSSSCTSSAIPNR